MPSALRSNGHLDLIDPIESSSQIQSIGIKVVVHAISSEAEAFNLHHGFIRLPIETPTYAIDLIKFASLSEWVAKPKD